MCPIQRLSRTSASMYTTFLKPNQCSKVKNHKHESYERRLLRLRVYKNNVKSLYAYVYSEAEATKDET